MLKRLRMFGLFFLIAGMLLSACKPAVSPTVPTTSTPQPTVVLTEPPTPTPVKTRGTITLWHAWRENEIASLEEVIRTFQAKYPDVKFDVLYVPFDELRGKFETTATMGGGPAILIAPAEWGPILADAGLVADLSGLASPDLLATFNPAALGAVRYKGALIGLPHTVKGVVMYRNKAIIPEAPKTVEELIAKAKAATQGDVTGAYLECGFFFSAGHLTACNGQLMDAQGYPAFNNEAGVCWLDLLKTFKEAGPIGYYVERDFTDFLAGKVGIIIDGSWNAGVLAEAIGADNLAIDPWPTYGTGHLSGFVMTENLYLNANVKGEDKDVAWLFMRYFLSPEAQAILANPAKAAHLPAVINVELPDPLMQEATQALLGGTTFPVIPEMSAYWGAMDTVINAVVIEDEKPEDPVKALQEAFDTVTATLEKLRSQ